MKRSCHQCSQLYKTFRKNGKSLLKVKHCQIEPCSHHKIHPSVILHIMYLLYPIMTPHQAYLGGLVYVRVYCQPAMVTQGRVKTQLKNTKQTTTSLWRYISSNRLQGNRLVWLFLLQTSTQGESGQGEGSRVW
jgi:hypothetical protein